MLEQKGLCLLLALVISSKAILIPLNSTIKLGIILLDIASKSKSVSKRSPRLNLYIKRSN